jgi:hypothetical protein
MRESKYAAIYPSARPRCHARCNFNFNCPIVLEDGTVRWFRIDVRIDRFRRECLRLRILPEFGSRPCSTILHPTSKTESWESDFRGWLRLDNRLYEVGISNRADAFEVYFRWLQGQARIAPALEVVR